MYWSIQEYVAFLFYVEGMMKEAEDDLGKRVRTLKAQSKESGIADDNLLADISSIDGLIMRVRFIKLFLSSLLMLKYTEGNYRGRGANIYDSGVKQCLMLIVRFSVL